MLTANAAGRTRSGKPGGVFVPPPSPLNGSTHDQSGCRVRHVFTAAIAGIGHPYPLAAIVSRPLGHARSPYSHGARIARRPTGMTDSTGGESRTSGMPIGGVA